eukprot:NODE_91_length_21779_cov_0.171356.p15 type:complete len:144 gc:universal NODE_91_length_21779_cov_0.171356:5771-5340(-)
MGLNVQRKGITTLTFIILHGEMLLSLQAILLCVLNFNLSLKTLLVEVNVSILMIQQIKHSGLTIIKKTAKQPPTMLLALTLNGYQHLLGIFLHQTVSKHHFYKIIILDKQHQVEVMIQPLLQANYKLINGEFQRVLFQMVKIN